MGLERIELKGDFSNTTIKDKLLSYSGGYLSIVGCNISGCEFEVVGEAGAGVQFMKEMFDAGAKCLVMRTFLDEDEYTKVKLALGWSGEDGNQSA
tara:strand:- start:49 stop:333 length:285 start_codon:yes stop_codon:yes gene_type:complete